MNETLINLSSAATNLSSAATNWYVPGRPSIQEVTVTTHAISPTEASLAFLVFVFLAYWYVRVTKNPGLYKEWKNPNGRVINLYQKVRMFFYIYVGLVIVLGIVQILLFRPPG